MSPARRTPSQQRSREMVEWIVEAAARVGERDGIEASVSDALTAHGVDDPHGRARLLVASIDAQVHGVLTYSDAGLRASRLTVAIDQALLTAGL